MPKAEIKQHTYTCNECNKQFQWKSSVSRHTLQCHPKDDRLLKSDILTETIVEDQKKQKISHVYKNFTSQILYSSDSDCEYELLQTVVKIKRDHVGKHDCKVCGKSFVKSHSLSAHLIKHSRNKSLLTPKIENVDEIQPKPKKHTFNNYDDHRYSIVKLDDELNETKNDSDKINRTNRKYNCRFCDKSFTQACSLTNHKKFHVKQIMLLTKFNVNKVKKIARNRYPCSTCNKSYSQKIHLDNHVAVHKQERTEQFKSDDLYTCTFCGKSFGQSGHFVTHLSVHVGDRPHLCSTCGKSFGIRRHLLVHQRTHTKEKPFTCEQCNKRFMHKASLTEHLRIHSGIKPHTCSFCNKTFTHYSGLTQHLRTHTDDKKYICEVCGKAFRFGGHYRDHLRRHSGDRPFSCKLCDKAFTSKSSLTIHIRTHSGDRPFKCTVCKKAFIKSCGLKQHKKTHSECNVEKRTINDES